MTDKEQVKLLIKEEVSKMFEEYFDDEDSSYDPRFDFEDIKDMEPGGAANKQAIADMASDASMSKYIEPSNGELKDLIDSLMIANLDLPSEQELINQAKEALHRELKGSEINKIRKTIERMSKIAGAGSYN